MGVYEVDPLQDPRWNELVQSHAQGCVFHSPSWLKALRGAYGYDPIVVSTCAPNKQLTNGLVFCRVESWLTGHRFVSLPFSDHCDPLVNSEEELDLLLASMKRRVDAGNWKYVEIRPVSWRPSTHAGLGESLAYRFHRLDLRKSSQELFHSFHKDCVQRKIRRAEREGLKYEEGTSEALLQKFYKLLVMTRRRQYLPPQPMAWFRELVAAFGDDLKIRVACKGEIPVASILTLSHKRSMVYKYGCSNVSFNKLGGTALLFWKTIQEAKDNGFEEFDIGRSNIDNLGLIAFKERWGAAGTVLRYWTYPHKPQAQSGPWRKRLIRQVVSATPDLVLQAMGTLLSRHVG
jgi:CelD/BcsL family acetyltransferase involved in cellulose biosynthesis